ncbi:KUP/HAK/KT family potassium transporter, partial [Sinorhizobium meliloti]|uniref:KUP/HAK/KT family potassium transporter n=1 Tax=Rhizobium meliloti TaxID=382 RepID=UPI000FE13433
LLKVHHGGYVPILIAGTLITMMWTWRKGVSVLRQKTARQDIPLSQFMAMVERKSEHAPVDVPGTAIFLTATPDTTPAVLLHNIKHNHVLHQHNVIMTIKTARVPYVPEKDRYTITKLSDRFSLLELRFGFMDNQNVSRALVRCRKEGFKFEIMSTSFYLGRRKLIADPRSGLPQWQDKLFIAMADSAIDPTEYFHLPPNRVVELGEQVII